MTWAVRDDWDASLAPDIYYTRAYMDLYRTPASVPLLFEFSRGGETFRLPFMESRIGPAFPGAPEGLKDMESAYGYGGPWSTSADGGFLAEAMAALDEACIGRRIVAGFLRFHPVLGNEGLAPSFRVLNDRPTVCADLSDPDIWNNQISQKNRNVIRKAEREGVTVEVDAGFERMRDFTSIYRETMERLGAQRFYAFGEGYFEGFSRRLGKDSFLVHALIGGKVAASAMIMRWGTLGHYHLSGSRKEFQKAAPNNLMLYRAMLALKDMGVTRFHMGGGLSADPEDPLFRFKKAFSGHTRPFHIGKRVFLETEYGRIRESWTAAHPDRAEEVRSKVLFYRF